ncbi:MAG: hypothetical protein ACJA2S_003898 [Cyclobacteriaceae bacterium]|jgi:hypothetical protein
MTSELNTLFKTEYFKPVGTIDDQVPSIPGLYCLSIREKNQLPNPFSEILYQCQHNIIYIGLASKSLKSRMLHQELRSRGKGTFFRSIGAVLGYRPEPGSLREKENKYNFTFSRSDKNKIVQWINEHLLVNWIELREGLNEQESKLIGTYQPLLNKTHNPSYSQELEALRAECRKIAMGD